MMKQPADNPNATPFDERQSAERVRPVRDPAREQREIEEEARRLCAQRDSQEYSREEWNQAAEIVRNRRNSLSKA